MALELLFWRPAHSRAPFPGVPPLMNAVDDLDNAAVRDLLLRNWMTHDAMWFREAVSRHGIAAANAMNRAAVRNMAAIEAKRIMRLIGMDAVRTNDDVRAFFDAAIAIAIPDFITSEITWADDNSAITLAVTRCFAHDGVAAAGVIAQYECGIFERLYGWLDALGAEYSVEPDTLECLMHTRGACARTMRISLKEPATAS